MEIRPNVKFLSDYIIPQILTEAMDILCGLGVTIYDDDLLGVLGDHGASINPPTHHVIFTCDMIEKALRTVPSSFKLFDAVGNETHHFSGYNVYFTPASSALNILDPDTSGMRPPTTEDYIRYVQVTAQLEHVMAQSTAFVPSDVDETISDSYRLYLNLMYGEKPVVTGTFNESAFEIMKEMQLAVRGSEAELKDKPLTIFSCCPTTPLKWNKSICRDIISCGKAGIPVELISMPLTGFTGPVSLTGSLIGHTAETLSGIVISQLTNPGSPLLYGGASAAFDMRHGTTLLGALESQMMNCATNEIGKFLGIPTQSYIALSDAKVLDAQAGLETAMGAVLGALSGINSISGPGMLDFVNCFSIEKLILDNELCGMIYRMLKGIEPREDFPALDIYRELIREQHLLASAHTMKYFKKEHYFPGKVIDRMNRSKWEESGSLTLNERAQAEVRQLLKTHKPSSLKSEVKKQLTEIMQSEARRAGMDRLPARL